MRCGLPIASGSSVCEILLISSLRHRVQRLCSPWHSIFSKQQPIESSRTTFEAVRIYPNYCDNNYYHDSSCAAISTCAHNATHQSTPAVGGAIAKTTSRFILISVRCAHLTLRAVSDTPTATLLRCARRPHPRRQRVRDYNGWRHGHFLQYLPECDCRAYFTHVVPGAAG